VTGDPSSLSSTHGCFANSVGFMYIFESSFHSLMGFQMTSDVPMVRIETRLTKCKLLMILSPVSSLTVVVMPSSSSRRPMIDAVIVRCDLTVEVVARRNLYST